MEDKKSFLVIGLTSPAAWEDEREEAEALCAYLDSGAIDLFHIRKPDASAVYTERLLKSLPLNYFPRLVLHSHYQLLNDFDFDRVHLKASEHSLLKDRILSRSCHTLDECKSNSEYFEYSFISPIFDSISKPGYTSRFNLNDEATAGILKNYPIVALGGVNPALFPNLFKVKFAGAALLGYLWSPKTSIGNKIRELREARKLLTE